MDLRRTCGRCQVALAENQPAYMCTQEHTFCATCFRALKYVCQDCGGELVRRPHPSGSRAAGAATRPLLAGVVKVRRATAADLDSVVPLFDAYRQFYEQPPDAAGARTFLSERLAHGESVILVAESDGVAVGFIQLYPLFSSVSLGRVYVLNDLFVAPECRRGGVGASLLEAARQFGSEAGASYLELSTAVDNPAQRLYEMSGWTLDREFLHYELLLPTPPKTISP